MSGNSLEKFSNKQALFSLHGWLGQATLWEFVPFLSWFQFLYGKFNDTPIWVVRKNKECGKMFKYILYKKWERAYSFSSQ